MQITFVGGLHHGPFFLTLSRTTSARLNTPKTRIAPNTRTPSCFVPIPTGEIERHHYHAEKRKQHDRRENRVFEFHAEPLWSVAGNGKASRALPAPS